MKTPAMACTLEEAYALSIACAAKQHHSEADAPEHALGEYIAAALDPLFKISAIVGDTPPCESHLHARRRSTEAQLLLVGALTYRLIETARELLDTEEPMRAATDSSIMHPLTAELTSAAVRAVDHGRLDRGFELPDLADLTSML
jgi:hypothetical protein